MGEQGLSGSVSNVCKFTGEPLSTQPVYGTYNASVRNSMTPTHADLVCLAIALKDKPEAFRALIFLSVTGGMGVCTTACLALWPSFILPEFALE